MDFQWQSMGGLLLDGQGDLALWSDPVDSVVDIVRSRLKAAIDGWQLYRIGADLETLVGNCNDAELEVSARRQVLSALTNSFLPQGSFQVKTLRLDQSLYLFVYLSYATIQAQIAQGQDGFRLTVTTTPANN